MALDHRPGARLGRAVSSMLDPRAFAHVLRLVHHYNLVHVSQRRRMAIGTGVRFSPTASIANGERVAIGEGSSVGDGVHLWAGDRTGRITIGRDCLIAPNVFVTASDYRLDLGTRLRDQTRDERDVTIGDGVWLGANAVVTAGVTIGDGAVVGAGAVVTRDVPSNAVAVGSPARVVRYREGAPETAASYA
jgi:acetyltransferase-like isoleucine patch superfamily enzyme